MNNLLIGPSENGKSCLIKSILKLENEKMVESEMTKPTTKAFDIYESNKMPNIRLIDSRGIEKGNYDVKTWANYVESLQLKGNIDNFIHCIWYGITGTRFEDVEENFEDIIWNLWWCQTPYNYCLYSSNNSRIL